MTDPMFADLYRGKRVFVTGHTGFKGSWLTQWLLTLGADVTGFSDRVYAAPDLFSDLDLEQRITHIIGDVRDQQGLDAAVQAAKPDFVFHLAAQPIVRLSYREPISTMSTNVMGTAHLLEVLRACEHPVSCVIVTSDKCYENREVLFGYREDDPLGGHDPYSASKGAAEIVAHSYRRSFFSAPDSAVKVATARAGNVIGGGDWCADRIVPDCVRSLIAKTPISVRAPYATRPWQHVLEPLSGYLWLAAVLTGRIPLPLVSSPQAVSQAFNFGPWPEANRTVGALVGEFLKHWPGSWTHEADAAAVHEAKLLSLAIDKAYHVLRWQPVYDFSQGVGTTAQWYRDVSAGTITAQQATTQDIAAYGDAARKLGVAWATLPPATL